jgi:hypothetical protein
MNSAQIQHVIPLQLIQHRYSMSSHCNEFSTPKSIRNNSENASTKKCHHLCKYEPFPRSVLVYNVRHKNLFLDKLTPQTKKKRKKNKKDKLSVCVLPHLVEAEILTAD